MKKTLLLSMAATAVLFAGGTIEKVVVPEEVKPCPTSNLKWYGQTVLYYQTSETINAATNFELFDGNRAWANAGLKLGVTGTNLLGTGLGFGAEVVALGTLGLEKDTDGAGNQEYVVGVMQMADQDGMSVNGGALTQLYLTYAMANTTAKVGRMQLPKSLSPFAFSEGWNVFKNTFEAALLVNTDLPDTTLVGAWVARGNGIGNLGVWGDLGANDNGVFMLTAQNKSIEGLSLTGTVYFASEAGVTTNEDLMILWGDAKFMMPVAGHNIGFGVQGGMIDSGADDNTVAYGVKAMGKFNLPAFGNVALCAAYTGVNMNTTSNATVQNSTGVKTPLYTQMVANQNYISGAMSENGEANTMMVKGTATYDLPALGNVSFTVAYAQTELVDGNNVAVSNLNDYKELDVIAKTKLGGAEVLAAYVNQTQDNSNVAGVASNEMDTQIVRVWAKWNF